MTAKLQAKTKEELVGELAEIQRRLEEAEEADRHNRQAAASLLESAKLFRTIADNAVDAIISGDKDEKVTYWNRAAGKIFGYDENEIIGQPVARLIPERYREAHKKGLRRVVETGETKIVGKTVELAGLRQDGTECPLELSLSMGRTREGPVFTVVARDISKRHLAAKALKESEERYRNTLDNMLEGCQIIGFDWRYLYVNDVAASHGRRTKAELLGYAIMEVYPGIENTDLFAVLRRCMVERTSSYLENEFTYPDDATGWFELSIQPVPEGLFILSADITERKRMEEELRMERERLVEAQRIAHLGNWDWDIVSNALYWSEEVYHIFGLPPDEFGACYESFLGCVHPDDRESVKEAVTRAVHEGALYSIGHRVLRPDGSVRHVYEQGEVFFEKGKPVRMIGTVLDTTDIRKADEKLQRISRQNELLLNSTGEGIYGVDLEGNATFVNHTSLQMTGYEQEEVIGANTHALWHHTRPDGSSYPEKDCPIYATYTDGSPRYIDNEVFWRKDGSGFPVEYNVRAIFENGKQVGTVVSFQDITGRRKAEEETRRLNRALQTLSKANEVLIRAGDEKELLDNVCRIIVDVGGYGLTWIGYAEHDAERSVSLIAHAGGDIAFIKAFRPSWAEDEQGQNPAGYAIRDGQPKLITHGDISGSPGGWHTAAAACGYEACLALPLIIDTEVLGALCICSTEAGKFTSGEARLLTELADDLAFGIGSLRTRGERERAEKELKQSLERIKKITSGVTQALVTAAEMRDPYTAGHQQRVTHLAVAIAREMNLDGDQVEFIRTGGALHDVGKISVPAEILTNPGKLTDLEFEMVREHSKYSYEILKEAEFPWPVAELVAQHHERLDGSGYPKGLKGDEIMLEAKILAVADVVEAMSSHRPYRPSLGIDAAIEEITRNRGVLYDEEVVNACVRLLKENKFSFESAAGRAMGAA